MLLLDPLTDESQADIAAAMAVLPGLGEHWWDRFPAPPPPDPAEESVRRTAQLQQIAAMSDGEIGS